MKQARRWLLIIAALTLLPSAAMAQAKKKKPATGSAASAPKQAEATAPAQGAPVDMDDQPAPAADATGAAPAATGGDTAGAAGGGAPGAAGGDMDICAITPDAPQCSAKPLDIGAEAKKTAKAEIYAVQQIYALRYHRFELMPYWSFTLNDQFVSHPAPGLSMNYYVTQVLSVGITGDWYGGLNSESGFNFENRRSARIAVPLNEYQWGANVNMTYVPVYGKFAGFSNFIFNYDLFLSGGVGAISTRPIAVIDPENRTFDFKPTLDFDLAIGLRIFFNRWFAAVLDVRDYIYMERLESLTINTADKTNPNDWTQKSGSLTNAVQAQVGVSIFLPFTWEYRLPK